MAVFVFIQLENILQENSGNLDQTPQSAASDLGLHCLPMSHKKDARLIWVNPIAQRGLVTLTAIRLT